MKSKVFILKSTELGIGLEKVAKNVLVHIKENKKVYIQIGKVCVWATVTGGLLLVDNITGHAAINADWANNLNGRLTDMYSAFVTVASWVIALKGVWDTVSECIQGNIRKAPSVMLAYLIIVAVLYAVPFGLDLVRDLFTF